MIEAAVLLIRLAVLVALAGALLVAYRRTRNHGLVVLFAGIFLWPALMSIIGIDLAIFVFSESRSAATVGQVWAALSVGAPFLLLSVAALMLAGSTDSGSGRL